MNSCNEIQLWLNALPHKLEKIERFESKDVCDICKRKEPLLMHVDGACYCIPCYEEQG